MKLTKIFFLSIIILSFSGCALTTVAPPSESAISADAFEIIVPKNLIPINSSFLKGVKLNSFKNLSKVKSNNEIKHFFSVDFKENIEESELKTEVCRGEIYSSGLIKKSCIFYDAKVTIQEQDSIYKIIINPYKMSVLQGRNILFLPIKLPEASLNDWYGWLLNQTVSYEYKKTSHFPPESIKGNFDRNLKKHIWKKGESDTGLRQFKDVYFLEFGQGSSMQIGASFFPYREGSLVELSLRGESGSVAGKKQQDWSDKINKAVALIDDTIKD